MKYLYSVLYVLSIPAVSWAFVNLPMVRFANGDVWTAAALIVGLVFVLRDYAQREVGKRGVLLLMAVATTLTFLIAAPELAAVSTIAFAMGELADWLVFTFTRYRFSTRVLLSSLFAVPVDSAVVLYGLEMISPGYLTWGNFLILCTSKFVGALAVSFIARKRGE